MKATMESTTIIQTIIMPTGERVLARRWNAVSEKGVPFTAWITFCQVRADKDRTEFERELAEHKVERELVSFDLRMAVD